MELKLVHLLLLCSFVLKHKIEFSVQLIDSKYNFKIVLSGIKFNKHFLVVYSNNNIFTVT